MLTDRSCHRNLVLACTRPNFPTAGAASYGSFRSETMQSVPTLVPGSSGEGEKPDEKDIAWCQAVHSAIYRSDETSPIALVMLM